jgi:superoxide reductase
MAKLGERIQTGDWKQEKHVPVIECPSEVKPDDLFEVKVGLGKEVAHPNTTEHHIRWINVFFHPEGEKFTYQVAHFDFTAHGESAEGPNRGPVYTNHSASFSMKIGKSGVIHALSLCNIHGLWESTKEISVTAK